MTKIGTNCHSYWIDSKCGHCWLFKAVQNCSNQPSKSNKMRKTEGNFCFGICFCFFLLKLSNCLCCKFLFNCYSHFCLALRLKCMAMASFSFESWCLVLITFRLRKWSASDSNFFHNWMAISLKCCPSWLLVSSLLLFSIALNELRLKDYGIGAPV